MINENETVLLFAVASVLLGSPLLGYVGPGTGLTAIGAALALLACIFLMIVGFIWYPIKRLLRLFSKPKDEETKEATMAAETGNSSEPSE